MVKGSERRTSDHPIDPLFLDRWSPRAMTGETIPTADLMTLFEAARWAPSSYNNQPWRILYAARNSPHRQRFFDLLVEANQAWAKNAGALLLFLSKKTFNHGKTSITHSFDTGAAWETLALQGSLKSFVVHGMQGFGYDRARTALNVPDDFQIEARAAVWLSLQRGSVARTTASKRSPSDRRKLAETICEGPFCFK